MKYRVHQNGGARTAGPPPSPHQRALARGLELHQAGRLAEAEAVYRQVLATDPGNAQGLHLLGALANQVGQHAAAVELISQAIQIEPTLASFHSNLGVAYQNLGRLEEAVASYERALALKSDHVDALNNLGVALQALGRLDGALVTFERSLKLRPNHPETLNNVGALYLALGRLDDGEARLRRSLKLRPGYAEALTNLGGVLMQRGRAEEALATCEQAVKAAPADARAHDMLGTILRGVGRADEAIASYERALAFNSNGANTWLNLAGTLQVAGRTVDATAAYRQALALNPASSIAHSGLIFALDLLPGMNAEARAERRRWNERFGQAWHDRPAGHPNDPDPERPLRVGYVSADFYHHSAAMVFMPILRMHDHAQVQIFCYSGATTSDPITEEARGLADVWHDVAHLSDDGLEAQIRADQIDVLVDLSGHSAGNRLPVFARKPAPIQATAWGYATGTGLEAIDAFLIDRVVVPPQERADYAEAIVELPSPICFEPPAELPSISPLPALSRGYVTFGAFNRLPKVSEGVRDAWARVLLGVPGSRLLVKSGAQDTETARQQLVDDLVARGVAREQIAVLGHTTRFEHLAAHTEVDIVLDTFPHTGGVTTVEALLMGVPVVTLLGEGVAGRLSASFLTALGLDDLIAETTDGYVSVARRLAGNLDRLADERATLRERLLASPIGDTRAYTRAVEAAYREFWRRWCAGRVARAE
jgi:predicted O-linked N-acetylglucosamine transferase (SPINDLY family)